MIPTYCNIQKIFVRLRFKKEKDFYFFRKIKKETYNNIAATFVEMLKCCCNFTGMICAVWVKTIIQPGVSGVSKKRKNTNASLSLSFSRVYQQLIIFFLRLRIGNNLRLFETNSIKNLNLIALIRNVKPCKVFRMIIYLIAFSLKPCCACRLSIKRTSER